MPPLRPGTRRALQAEQTRAAIAAAARSLFSSHGYSSVRVEQIAELAGVAPATVYAVNGGKQGLIAELVRQWREDPLIDQQLQTIRQRRTLAECVELLASGVSRTRQRWSDVEQVLVAAAARHDSISDELTRATCEYRRSIDAVAQHLADNGLLAPGMTENRAAEILWFYLGFTGFHVLVQEDHWSWPDAEAWLAQQAVVALA